MMRRIFDHLGVSIALVILATLVSAVAVIQVTSGRAVPDGFRHVLPNATGYVVTGPLRALWSNGPSHLRRLYSQAASANGKELIKEIREFLSHRCMTTDDLTDLSRFGVDEMRGVAFTLLDYNRTVTAIPVSDPVLFASFMTRFVPTLKLSLSSAAPKPPKQEDDTESDSSPNAPAENTKPAKVLKAIRIDANLSRGAVFCSPRSGQTNPLVSGSVIEPPINPSTNSPFDEITFDVSLLPNEAAAVGVRCTSIFTDGTTDTCYCQIQTHDCAVQTQTIEPTLLNGMNQGQPVAVDPGATLYYTERTALIVQAPEVDRPGLAQGASRTRDNLRYFRGDNTLSAALLEVSPVNERDDGIIIGGMTASAVPLTGRLHFALTVGTREIAARLLLPWQTLQSTLLEQLITPSAPIAGGDPTLSTNAELRVNDSSLGYYLRFIESYSDQSKRQLRRLGNFFGFVQEIMEMERVGPFHFAARGVRDGVPDLIMSLAVSSDEAQRLLEGQRARMRVARDREILWAAARKFIQTHDNRAPTQIDELKPYLKEESGALWDRYEISSDASWDDDATAAKAFELTNELGSEDFAKDYSVTRDDRVMQYVAPPFTENDELYRLTADRGKIATLSLRTGRFRLAVYFDERSGRLIIGSDAEALADALKSPAPAGASAAAPPQQEPKFRLTGDPSYLINQGLLYPDPDFVKFMRDSLLDFEQYRTLDLHVEPLASRQAISATIVLSHE